MRYIIFLVFLLPLFSCEEDIPEQQNIDYSAYPTPLEFASVYNTGLHKYGFIFAFEDYAIQPSTIGLTVDVDLRGKGNTVEFFMRGAPHNSFVIDSTMQTTIELSGIMPSRSTDLYIDMSVGDGNIEPAYVTGFINYAVYEGDTIENVNPVRFVVNRAEARLD